MIFQQSELLIEDASIGVSTSFKQRYQSMLLVLELLPYSNYIVAWVILRSLSIEEAIFAVF